MFDSCLYEFDIRGKELKVEIHGSASFFNNHCFSWFGQGWQIPSTAIKLLQHCLQNLWFSVGTKPSGHLLQEPSKFTFSSALQCEQERLSPSGKDPSGHGSHSPLALTISFMLGHGSHAFLSGLRDNTVKGIVQWNY